jgi:hypothetical protein
MMFKVYTTYSYLSTLILIKIHFFLKKLHA